MKKIKKGANRRNYQNVLGLRYDLATIYEDARSLVEKGVLSEEILTRIKELDSEISEIEDSIIFANHPKLA